MNIAFSLPSIYSGSVNTTAWAVILIIPLLLTGCTGNGSNPSETTLKEAYQGRFTVGVAVQPNEIDGTTPEATRLIQRHFNSISPENLLKWERVHPRPDTFRFEAADRYLAFGEEHGMEVIGHTLVWHSQVPDWVFRNEDGRELGREALLGRMKDHIESVAGRYRGRIDGWDVVNEAVLDNGEIRQTPWYRQIGPDYVEKAFEYAHEAAPEAQLYYNDYNLWKPAKREAVIDLVRGLQNKGIPIHGVGMQAHLGLTYPPVAMMEESIRAFSELDVKVMITELDIDLLPDRGDLGLPDDHTGLTPDLNPYAEALPDSVMRKLTDRYVSLFTLFNRHHDKISRVTFWGLDDGHSWRNNFPIRGRTNYPLLFDRDYQPKPALQEIIQLTSP